MRNFVVALMVGTLAFSGPALAQPIPPSPPPTPPPFLCDPAENPDPLGVAPCYLLVGSVFALWGIIIAEGTQKNKHAPIITTITTTSGGPVSP